MASHVFIVMAFVLLVFACMGGQRLERTVTGYEKSPDCGGGKPYGWQRSARLVAFALVIAGMWWLNG
ncbi:hypothetical protein C7I85_29940 [Mesorhizobium soli]|uniref:Uncharacterized protein n=1 Tax=Pseudaminobacter soli (ex Li et al. 2025) TaxID=1295366 RepID=A0A2P7RKL6_9HYPH|nr:hypothetical protein C7I85_29940 [Mesorhizobium soli]